MDSDAVWRVIDEQRTRVADLLEGLSGREWSTSSLCDGWTASTCARVTSHGSSAAASASGSGE